MTGGSGTLPRGMFAGAFLAGGLLLSACTGEEPAAESTSTSTEASPSARSSEPLVSVADERLLEAIDLYTGVAGLVDDARARELIWAVAEETESPLSRMWVARARSRGRMGVERDTVAARAEATEVIEDIARLAEAGEPEAIFLMGTAYDEGLGRAIDYPTALTWYERAGQMGHVLAQHNAGNMHAAGRGTPPDAARAVDWWRRAADRGDAITQLRLGEAYEEGRGVTPDLGEALAWYRKAAQAGNAAAAEAVDRLTGG